MKVFCGKLIKLLFLTSVILSVLSHQAFSGPVQTGLTAAGDSASTAYWNPAGMTLLERKEFATEIISGFADSEFEVTSTETDRKRVTISDGNATIPAVYYVHPMDDRWWVGISANARLGFSADYADNWEGRYFMEEWLLGFAGCDVVVARRLNDKLSLSGGVSITYSLYEMESAVRNIDPSYGDGQMELSATGIGLGYSLSAMYELNPKTRFGLVYRSEIDPTVEGEPEFSNLDPQRTEMLESSGVLGNDVEIDVVSPRMVQLGFFHQLSNAFDVTVDLFWINFEEFGFKQVAVGDTSLQLDRTDYQDIYAGSIGVGYHVNEDWTLRLGGLYASEGVDDENRSFFLKLDRIIGIGTGVTYRLNRNHIVSLNINYYDMGEAPVKTRELPRVGVIEGEYTKNQAIAFEFSYQWKIGN